ncbi:15584_t:CDS:2 [Dentiscutata heterogama]|uniref:15584_t:CDS:1 n=1 Tax=Dentiscutata heterogama TaxID=1316150 RepID=A0ACA9KUN6_9GLOM|nr:15584_t:CDS:2 [Dentiscutata heterogama]
MSSQVHVISSLVISSTASISTPGLGYVLTRRPKPNSLSRMLLLSKSFLNSSKYPLERFKLFCSKNKKNKNLAVLKTNPPMMVCRLSTDDKTPICSDATSIRSLGKAIPVQISPENFNSSIINAESEDEEDWDTTIIGAYDSSRSKSLRKLQHSRCESAPSTSILRRGSHRRPAPSESWDDDFDLDSNEINVPYSVKEAQSSLRMDISNIRDFASQNKKLDFTSTIHSKMGRKWKTAFNRSTMRKYKNLENLFKQDWEEAKVIIDLSDVAQDKQSSSSSNDESVKVDIERIPSERHAQVFKKIILEELGEDARNVIFLDDDKENFNDNNYTDSSLNSAGHTHSAKKQKLANGESSSNGGYNKGSTKRKENIRISLEIMPNLIDHLKKLQNRLSDHLNELKTLSTNKK